MAEIELICFLLMVVAALDVVARRINLPYPVLLVLSGLALSLIPFLPHVDLDPELALLVFLPPQLYPAALFTSWCDFLRNIRAITLLAFGLVLMTTLSVASVAQVLIPGLPWPAALILGAIVSPPGRYCCDRRPAEDADSPPNRRGSRRRESCQRLYRLVQRDIDLAEARLVEAHY